MIEIFKGGLICLGVTGRGDAELIKGADSEGVGWVEGGWGPFSPSNEAQRPPPSLPRAIKKGRRQPLTGVTSRLPGWCVSRPLITAESLLFDRKRPWCQMKVLR